MGAAAIPVAIAVVGTVASTAAAVQQSRARKAQAEFQGKVAENNAELQRRAAEDARERGKLREQQKRLQTRQRQAGAKAQAAARGVQVGTGSALDIQADIAELGELDALTIRQNATREALGFETGRRRFEGEAGLRRAAGRSAQRAGRLQAGATLASGGGRVATKWQTAYGDF